MHNHVWRGVSSTCKSTLSGCWEPLPPVTRKPQGGPPVSSTTLPPVVNSRPPVNSTTLPPDILMLDCLLLSFFNVGDHHRPEIRITMLWIIGRSNLKSKYGRPEPKSLLFFGGEYLSSGMQTKKVPWNFVEKSQGGRSCFGRNSVQGRKLKLLSFLPRIPGRIWTMQGILRRQQKINYKFYFETDLE